MSLEERNQYLEQRRKQAVQEKQASFSFDKSEKYRCEQMVICKINNVPTNNAQTKREFIVSKAKNELGELFVKVKIIDNVLNITPQNYQEAVMLVAELDNLKCDNIIVRVNSETGEIHKIMNHQEIIQKWKQHKLKLQNSYNKVPSSEKKSIDEFINMVEKQICVERNLIDDLKSKPFFDLFFNKYLINSKDKLENYNRVYQSQLFQGFTFDLIIKQSQNKDSLNQSVISKTGKLVAGQIDRPKMEKAYDQQYKLVIQYKFSEFDVSFTEQTCYDPDWTLLESEVTMIEEVTNNLQLFIHYTLRKLEDNK